MNEQKAQHLESYFLFKDVFLNFSFRAIRAENDLF